MRKILLALIIVILVAFGISTMVNGSQIGGLKISSIEQIETQSKELDSKIEEINILIDSKYPATRDQLTDATKKLQNAKEQYSNEINTLSNEELENTLKIKNFDIERIWAVVGNHAIDEGVNITLNLTKKSTTGARNMHFTVIGTYVAQTNFLYAIENDKELNYRIYNYKLIPYTGGTYSGANLLQATFAIKETIITKSLNDKLNGYEYEDQKITDSIFNNPQDAVNGKKTTVE